MDEDLNRLIAAVAGSAAHKPYEALLSGPGLSRLHRLRTGAERCAPDILAAFEAGEAEESRTLSLFTRLLGTVTGNLALTHMATGGIYLIGGLARALIRTGPWILDDEGNTIPNTQSSDLRRRPCTHVASFDFW